ncbi:MAG: cation transporter [Bacteroidota bacterium]|nr:cation transporter [Bacteroidota bacterium]
MNCASCNNHVAATLKALSGVVEQKVDDPGDVATVKFNPAKTCIDDIIKAIEKIGNKATNVSEKAILKQS